VVRTCIEAMAATQGHTQSLHTNALDEALALPSDFSARIARNTQLFLQQETDTCRVVDPWGGSYYVERADARARDRARAHIREVEDLGGMAEAITAGIPKMRIEEAAARTQARIDSGRQAVVGLNTFRLEQEDELDVRKIDNAGVLKAQIESLKALRAERDQVRTDAALAALTRVAESGEGNLLEACVDAARAHATVGEMSEAMEKVFGRHRARTQAVRGVYGREMGGGHTPCRASATRSRGSRRPRGGAPGSSSRRWGRTGTTGGRR
jgi:methylmalonyl-CoA mutase